MFKITKRRQQQAVRDFMFGQESLSRDQLSKDYQFLWDIVSDGRDEFESYQLLVRVKDQEPDLAADIDVILGMVPGSKGGSYRSLAEIAPELDALPVQKLPNL